MVKNTSSRTERPTPPRRVRRRRDSKVPYHHSNPTRNTHRNASGPSTRNAPGHPYLRHEVLIHQHSPPGQPLNMEYLDLFDFQSSAAGPSSFQASPSPHDQAGNSWLSSSMNPSYTLPTRPPNSSESVAGNSSNLNTASLAQIFDNTLRPSWQTINPIAENLIPGAEILPDGHLGSYDSFDSLALTVNTAASSVSDSYACPKSGSSFGSPGASHLLDLYLPESYFDTRHSLDDSSPQPVKSNSPPYPEPFAFETGYMPGVWSGMEDIYKMESDQWSSSAITETQAHNTQSAYSENTPIPAQSPWNSQAAQESGFVAAATTGCVAFEPSPGLPYHTFRVGEEYLRSDQRTVDVFSAQPVSPTWDCESEEWHIVPSYPASSIRSQASPQSQDSPWSHVGSPPPGPSSSQIPTESHSHVFSTYAGEPKSNPTRGRQRALTSQEKEEALVVRKAKACWACHLSKIKCSPCSPGSPCQQCERLDGKRRFCWLPCFNDPLESLQIFMAPDYLYGGYTKARVEAFVSENATGWGTHEMVVRMDWGYWQPLEETVVAISMREDSELAYQHQSISNGRDKPTLLRKASPPLGLPLAAMDDMQSRYSSVVQRIVTEDLMNYVSVPYNDQDSSLPERLLQAIAIFYSAALVAGDKCDILRQALEIHIIMTILARSLVLDENSLYQVESYLQQRYPPRSAARLASRQMKLVFYQIQRARISKVLEDWGKEMWTSNKNTPPEKKWAITFSVFIILTLVTDKILASAYYSCEAEIKHHGADPKAERAEFRELVRLTEKELFDRCKEIFHSSFKTRKAGKEAYNPIRDGKGAFRGQAVNEGISRFVWDLQTLMRDFEPEIRSHKSSKLGRASWEEPYTNKGRLASIFLAEFLDH